MPYSDPEKARAYFRNYRRLRRAGDERSTPVHPAVSAEFRLQTAGDVLAMLEDQCQAVYDDDAISTTERARVIGYLGSVTLKAIECGDLAARLEAIEVAVKAKKRADKQAEQERKQKPNAKNDPRRNRMLAPRTVCD
ncbi:MAG: hypothetical protein U0836_09240 [Pirellulales bacterium]